jgi:hypothetical protein
MTMNAQRRCFMFLLLIISFVFDYGACGNLDATTAPQLAGPVQAHGATTRGAKSPVREGPASAGTPRAWPERPRTLENSDLPPMGYQPTPGTV